MRRFHEGQTGSLPCGFEYRVTRGRKGPHDLVLEVRGESRYRYVPMELGFLIHDFMTENEEHLYLEQYHYRGGRYYTDKLAEVLRRGFVAVAQELNAERERRRRRSAALK